MEKATMNVVVKLGHKSQIFRTFLFSVCVRDLVLKLEYNFTFIVITLSHKQISIFSHMLFSAVFPHELEFNQMAQVPN